MDRFPATRTARVVDDYHGTKIADPFRWLENQEHPEVREWVRAQTRAAVDHIHASPMFGTALDRLTALWSSARRGVPVVRAGRTFGLHNDGTRPRDVLRVSDEDGDRVLVDPAAGGAETVALNAFEPSPDGRWVVYATSVGGSDWTTLRVVNAETGDELEDTIEWVKQPTIAWFPDSAGFVYSSLAPPEDGGTFTAENTGLRLRSHRLGRPADETLYEPEPGVLWICPHVTADGKYVVVEAPSSGLLFDRVLYRPADGDGDFVPLVQGGAPARFVGSDGDTFYLQTHLDAPNGRLVAVDLARPDPAAWRDIVPESALRLPVLLLRAGVFGRHLVSVHEDLMNNVVQVTSLDGADSYCVDLPGPGVVPLSGGELSGSPEEPVFHFAFSSWTQPPSVLRHDITTRETTTYFRPELPGYDPDEFVSYTVEVPSSGGVSVPVELVHRHDVERDGNRPVLVTGYGGFGLNYKALGFTPWLAVWLEQGGVLAVAGLRGGNERGESWHAAGMREHKQNVFDDCVAATQWLIDHGWTRPGRLALTGQSNGGLLAGAVLVRRPDLFAAVVPEVGVLDMLRYHRFTGSRNWISEYGCADDPDQFRYLYAYSPLHNVVEGTSYPNVLVTTGEYDDRVPPGPHSYKFAAALQAAQAGPAPILLRVWEDTGHGGGKTVTQEVRERAEVLAFLLEALNVQTSRSE
ncbi:prolyl oligopeptidase family serine peptidase [Amycolatopsis suaedae]|uniref:prolyl oligopeptidase n=1 Tax=Amycolatopsis suaedae TaxID=2510978 RepID=A0A4Q7JDZ0_9PSEU|nr:prolyl oligopeptidase family serine peptidase [Amycolatopsis suaedae]RZQ64594.1 S9 family peptidase [Amycolatopsis suaedae]